jgi:hypothetical protein
MIACIYHTLYGLELKGFFGLYLKQTDDASLLFYTTNMGRFTLPVCFNYLQVLGETKSSLTAFIGKLNLIPVLGEGFPKFFTCLFAVVLLFKLLNLHGRILGLMGLGYQKKSGSQKWTELVTEGKKIAYKQIFLVRIG